MTAPLRADILWARARLTGAGLAPDEAALDAEVLARHVLGWDRAQLLTRASLPAPDHFAVDFDRAIARRAAREPVALITGQREFWGLDFHVTGDVLVPRPETELIVELAVARMGARPPAVVIDVGTGSGCLAVALGHEMPAARIVAVDLSAAALAVAARNVARHGMSGRIRLLRGHLLDSIAGPAGLIVSNPPYVARSDAGLLQPEVLRFEPDLALFAEDDGLAVLRALCQSAASKLAPGGRLIVEFGAGQRDAVVAMAAASGWTIEVVADLAGHPRVAVMSRA